MVEYTAPEAITAGIFSLDAIKDDEKSIKAVDKLPDNMREVMLANIPYKSYKYGKANMKINATKNEVLSALVTISGDSIIYNGGVYKTEAQLAKLASLLHNVTLLDIAWTIENLTNMITPEATGPVFDRTALVAIYEEVLRQENASYISKTDEWKITDPETGRYEIKTDSYIKSKIQINVHRYQYTVDKNLKPAFVLSEFEDYKHTIRQQKFFALQRSITYNPEYVDFREEYLTVWYKVFSIKQDLDIWIALMSNFFLQIKRRIYDLDTMWEMMIAIYGNQGIGKSHALRVICKTIFGEYYDASITLDRLCDERNAKLLMDNYVLNIEELTQSGSTDMQAVIRNGAAAKLKTIITEKKGSFRPMRSNDSERIRINASIISNANFHIYDIINDETGMRRFFEFASSQPENVSVHITYPTEVQYLYDNALKFIRSINEENDDGYWTPNSELGLRVKAIQNSYIKVNTFSEFLSATYTVADESLANGLWVPRRTIIEEYHLYLKAQGVDTKFAIKNIDSKLVDAYGSQNVKKIHNVNHYCIQKLDNMLLDSNCSFKLAVENNAIDKYLKRGS